MPRTLTAPKTFEDFRADLFETVYPGHKVNAHFSLMWHSDDNLLVKWYGSAKAVALQDIWDAQQDDSTPALKMVKKWVEQTVLPTYDEALNHGVPMFNVSLRSWDFGVYRAQQLMLLPAEEVQGDRRNALKERCLTRLRTDSFRVQQKEAVVTLTSASPLRLPHCAGLFDLDLLTQVVQQVYDITPSTRFLVSATISSPVLLGHASAINRLSDGMEDNHVILDPSTLKTLG